MFLKRGHLTVNLTMNLKKSLTKRVRWKNWNLLLKGNVELQQQKVPFRSKNQKWFMRENQKWFMREISRYTTCPTNVQAVTKISQPRLSSKITTAVDLHQEKVLIMPKN